MPPVTADIAAVVARFEAKWTPEPNTGCWLWKKGTQAAGYGNFKALGEVTAHRVSYRLYRGPIPPRMHVLHACDVPQCVNPAHLFLGSQADNMRDCARKRRTQRHNALKTHCPSGHPYSGANLRALPAGGRACRQCERERALRWRHANLEAARARDRRNYWAKKGSQTP